SVISVIETNIHGCASDQTTKTVALSTVGISNQTLIDNVVIYPNPAEETLTIKTQTKGFISLIDVNGKRLIKEFFDANIDIDISLLPSGLYFVLIESNEGTFGQKIIKR
ncbi:MAG: T9SS type A sorting domain-containing protein, partial [Bacteroidia bacterium]|nr:T9SS type A sorting domain-containing protein [Bacteroidia bacterium]